MLYREINAVCSEITEATQVRCGQNVEFLNVNSAVQNPLKPRGYFMYNKV
jgi:hypothetical protein